MRTPFVAGNWKMFKTVAEAVKYIKEFRSLVKDFAGIDIVLAAPFTAIYAAAEAARNSNIGIAAQNVYWEREGAFTGEVSAPMIREAGAEFVIIGHSERRTLFGETDEAVNRKVKAAFAAGLTPIVCIGETLRAARGQRNVRRARRANRARARRADGRTGDAGRGGVRARVGYRYRPERDARAGRRRARAHPAAAAGPGRRRRLRSAAG